MQTGYLNPNVSPYYREAVILPEALQNVCHQSSNNLAVTVMVHLINQLVSLERISSLIGFGLMVIKHAMVTIDITYGRNGNNLHEEPVDTIWLLRCSRNEGHSWALHRPGRRVTHSRLYVRLWEDGLCTKW